MTFEPSRRRKSDEVGAVAGSVVAIAFRQGVASRFVFAVILRAHCRVPIPLAFTVYFQSVPPVVAPQVIAEFL